RDLEVRVALVVAEQDVVARLQGLDEVVLEQQRLGLGPDHRRFHARDAADHLADARAVVALLEIAADTLFQVARLAHVQQLPLGVEVAIDPGQRGQGRDLAEQLFGMDLGHGSVLWRFADGCAAPGAAWTIAPCDGTSFAASSTTWATPASAGACAPTWPRAAKTCACGSTCPTIWTGWHPAHCRAAGRVFRSSGGPTRCPRGWWTPCPRPTSGSRPSAAIRHPSASKRWPGAWRPARRHRSGSTSNT